MATPSTPPRRNSIIRSRPSSPTLSISGFSLIGEDEASSDTDYNYWGNGGSPYKSFGSFGRRAVHSAPVLNSYFTASSSSSPFNTPSPNSPLKSLIPRLWDVLTFSPTKGALSPSRTYMSPTRGSRFSSVGHHKDKRRAYYEQDFYRQSLHESLSYADLPPLDDDEGELIDVDDEACFVAIDYPWGAMAATRARVVTGIDVVALLPPELSLQIFWALAAQPSTRSQTLCNDSSSIHQDNLHALMSCLAVSKTWRHLANDNSVWRAFFTSRWGRLSNREPSYEFDDLFRQQYELDRRWNGLSREGPPNFAIWQPQASQLVGHRDSVYCMEMCPTSLGDDYIITGSRDRTMKFWCLNSGKCLGTFGSGVVGGELEGHRGSVLCVKFFWEVEGEKGIVYSGSSDSTVCIWDVWLVKTSDGGVEVLTRVQSSLRGHGGGVLDLKVVDNWIITCSKDGIIRIWYRDTLELSRTLRGHDGPVNAICVEDGKLVSASGDGKLILWDIATGERLRTLEGHDRGLACIEFKNGLIISGSNDCKIKIWCAATGECLNTLIGHDSLVRALSFDPVTHRLASASYDKSVRLWDVNTGKLLRDFKHHHASHIFDVKFDALRLVSASHDQRVTVMDFGHGLEYAHLLRSLSFP